MKTIYINESVLHSLITEAMSVDEIYKKYYQDIHYNDYQFIVRDVDPTYIPGPIMAFSPGGRTEQMGKYAKWLLGMFRKGTFKSGDFKEARELLELFDKYKNRLPVKDVTRLRSIGELYQLVKPFMEGEQATSKADEIRRAKAGAEKVYEDDRWLVVVPHTMEASRIYGENTKWCTAAENPYDNMFEYYDSKGNLYINIDKGTNRKYQFHFETDSFMDEKDNEIRRPIFETIGATKGLKEFYKNNVPFYHFIEMCGRFSIDPTCKYIVREYQNQFVANDIEDAYLPEAYLVWNMEQLKCAFVNSDGELITYWFDDAEPFRIYRMKDDPWRTGPKTSVTIIAEEAYDDFSNDVVLNGVATYNGNGISILEWKDDDGHVRYPEWHEELDDEYGSWMVEPAEGDEEEANSWMHESIGSRISFFTFFNEVKKFIAGLLTDPVNAKPSDTLMSYGLNNGKLRKMLRDSNIIQMKEKIDEPHNEDTGKAESMYTVSYKVPKQFFKRKIRRLYQRTFEK